MGKSYKKGNETKNWFFDKIKKMERPLARLTKGKREKTETTKRL